MEFSLLSVYVCSFGNLLVQNLAQFIVSVACLWL